MKHLPNTQSEINQHYLFDFFLQCMAKGNYDFPYPFIGRRKVDVKLTDYCGAS